MDTMVRGAAIGAFLGAGAAFCGRFLLGGPPEALEVETEALHMLEPLHRSIVQFKCLRDADKRCEMLYVDVIKLADSIAKHVVRMDVLPQFKFNRLCSEVQTRCKELSIQAGHNREFSVIARQTISDELPNIKKLCNDYLHNMILG